MHRAAAAGQNERTNTGEAWAPAAPAGSRCCLSHCCPHLPPLPSAAPAAAPTRATEACVAPGLDTCAWPHACLMPHATHAHRNTNPCPARRPPVVGVRPHRLRGKALVSSLNLVGLRVVHAQHAAVQLCRTQWGGQKVGTAAAALAATATRSAAQPLPRAASAACWLLPCSGHGASPAKALSCAPAVRLPAAAPSPELCMLSTAVAASSAASNSTKPKPRCVPVAWSSGSDTCAPQKQRRKRCGRAGSPAAAPQAGRTRPLIAAAAMRSLAASKTPQCLALARVAGLSCAAQTAHTLRAGTRSQHAPTSLMSPNGRNAECSAASLTVASRPPTYNAVLGLLPLPPLATTVVCVRCRGARGRVGRQEFAAAAAAAAAAAPKQHLRRPAAQIRTQVHTQVARTSGGRQISLQAAIE